MKVQVAFCSACDHDVRIALPDEPVASDGQANVPDPEIVCLEMGHSCTGALCPVGAQPPSVMAARLVRSGLRPVFQPLIASQCERCGTVTSFALIDPSYATCTQCGITVSRASLAELPVVPRYEE